MITFDFTEYDKEVREFIDVRLIKEYNKFIEKHALDLYNRVLEKTPYRTGFLLDNWQIDFEYVKEWLDVYLYNNAHYAIYVEEGTEKMAPRMMLALSLEEVYAKMEIELNRKWT